MFALENLRVGYGEDAHRLAAGHKLVLAGVELPAARGAVAHSDGDALLHAVSDAMLASIAMGDIGVYFPPSDPQFKGLDSAQILHRCLSTLESRGAQLLNISAVVTLDAPKLNPHREAIKQALATLLKLPPERVGLGFKTSEGLAPDHVQTRVTVLVKLLR